MSRIIAAALAAIFCFAALPAAAATTGLVRGTVLVNDKPQAGVTVTVRGEGDVLHATTDAAGNYVFPQIPFGNYTITASYGKLAPKSLQIQVVSDSVQTINFALGRLKTISKVGVRAGAGASGTPVSVNVVTKNQIAALPTNNSLNRLVETVPGIVRFSYDEPVAHGFHGITYELDGAPLPLATSSNFAEIIDPKDVDSMEIFTGAIPAEYGGNRSGAIVNIITNRANDVTVPDQGFLSVGGGNHGQMLTTLDNEVKAGNTEIFLNMNAQRAGRALEAPTFNAIHDNSSQSDQFLRTITNFDNQNSLSVDLSNQLAQFQIPINTNPASPYDPTFSLPSQDDVQREYDRMATVNFTHISKTGNAIFQVIPWTRFTRIDYAGDLPTDVLGMTNLGSCSGLGLTDPTCAANPNANVYQSNVGLSQNRAATYVGLRMSNFVASKHHAFKYGIDVNRETLSATETFACYDPTCATQSYTYPLPPPPGSGYTAFTTSQAQAGTQTGIYAEDKWTPTQQLSFSYGLRYDHSTGYVGGYQISPRIGVNYAPDDKNVLHAYYGRFYAAPQMEDVRQACVVLAGCPTTPVYDLKPETDAYFEMGLAHTFSPTLRGYINTWERNAVNVLDTTQLLNTPLMAVFNNALGRAAGVELRLDGNISPQDSWYLSGSVSSSQAACTSGSTFLAPNPTGTCDTYSQIVEQLAPEDHDQTVAANGAFTHRWGEKNAFFTTLQADYGTGYPVSFENAVNGLPVSFQGRLPAHLTLNWSLGRAAGRNGDRALGFDLDVENLLNHQYIIKIANGFNTTQIDKGRSILFRLTEPF